MLETTPLAEIDRRLEERLAGVRESTVNGNFLSYDDFVKTQLPWGLASVYEEGDFHTIVDVTAAFGDQLNMLMAMQNLEHPDLGDILTLNEKIRYGTLKAQSALKEWKAESLGWVGTRNDKLMQQEQK